MVSLSNPRRAGGTPAPQKIQAHPEICEVEAENSSHFDDLVADCHPDRGSVATERRDPFDSLRQKNRHFEEDRARRLAIAIAIAIGIAIE